MDSRHVLSLRHESRLYDVLQKQIISDEYIFNWFRKPEAAGPKNAIWAKPGRRGKFGLMSINGEWLIEPRFSYGQALYDNRAIVREDVAGEGSLSGAVDENGEIVIPLIHGYLSSFSRGYAVVGSQGRYDERTEGIIKQDGTILLEPKY